MWEANYKQNFIGGGIILGRHTPRWEDVSYTLKESYHWIVKPTGQILSRRGGRICTGFLISSQTFLTAGHCIGNVCKYYEEDSFSVSFNYHTNAKESTHEVREILEHGQCKNDCDYGIFKLSKAVMRDNCVEMLKIQRSDLDLRETQLIIAQHPDGMTKKISFGSLIGYRENGLFAHDMDTLPGSSGSPVAKAKRKAAVGVHVSVGNGRENIALAMETIAEVSERIRKKLV